jgi:PST family polysaccharide transporter
MKKSELALPDGLAARMTIRAIAVWLVAEHPFKVTPSLKAAREIVRFSAVVVSGQFLLICSSNADYFLVGRIFGATALGYYSLAWELPRFVPNHLHRIVLRVAMPLFCRIQECDDRLGAAYCAVISYCSRVILPYMGCLSVLAPYLIRLRLTVDASRHHAAFACSRSGSHGRAWGRRRAVLCEGIIPVLMPVCTAYACC